METNLFVTKGDTSPDKDLIYMKPLDHVLKRILEWYWDAGKTILDVTAGNRKCWHPQTIYGTTLETGQKAWNVIFLDASEEAKIDVQADFRKLPFQDNSVDLIFVDVPFMKATSGIEEFGIKKHKTPDRPFYFRGLQTGWIPPEAYFFQTWKEFNRVSRNGLIVKISDRYEKGYEIPVTTYMDLAYENRFNHKSEFHRCVRTGYRGIRAGMGAKMIHPQRVLSYYAVYKKNYKLR